MVWAIITAGGSGRRMKSAVKKQFLPLAGIPLLHYTLAHFIRSEEIDGITVVLPENYLDFMNNEPAGRESAKPILSVAGGTERTDSVYNGLRSISPETEIVIIHDGVRPFINDKLIHEVIESARETGAATVAVKPKDTIVVEQNGKIREHLHRSTLCNIQTPQAFRKELIVEAHERARNEGITGTDDTYLVHRLGKEVAIVNGSYDNIKITSEIDLIVAEAHLKNIKAESK